MVDPGKIFYAVVTEASTSLDDLIAGRVYDKEAPSSWLPEDPLDRPSGLIFGIQLSNFGDNTDKFALATVTVELYSGADKPHQEPRGDHAVATDIFNAFLALVLERIKITEYGTMYASLLNGETGKELDSDKRWRFATAVLNVRFSEL